MHNTIRRNGKRLMSMVLIVLIILSTFPITSFAASANLGEVNGADKIDVTAEMNYGHEIHYGTVNGNKYPLFCIEYGTTSPSSSYLEEKKAMASDDVIKAAKWIFAGYYMEHGNSIDKLDMAYCQKKVWSIMGSSTSWTFTDKGYKDWCDNAQANIDSLNTKPSFNGENIGTIVAGNTITINDTNKVLADYPAFTNTDTKGVTITHKSGENKLTISVSKDCTSTSFRIPSNKYFKNDTGDDDELLLYYPYGSKDYQKLIYSAYYDPISFALTGNITPLGNLKLIKTSEDGIVSNIRFTVTGTNYSKTVTTNSNGEFEIEDLVPGTYTVTEESITRYETPKSQTVKVESNRTSSVSFSNILKKGNIKIQKNCEDNLKSGLTFNVTGSDGSSYNATTNSNGIAEINNVPVYDVNNNKITYTVKETNVPIKYVTPDNQTVTLESDKTSTVTFSNILKKFRVTVTKSDIEKGHAQGDASLAGAVYGLYKGETLMASYTTDSNASFTTDYFVCDTDWTIREISSSEGYLVNSKVYPVGADPKLYTVEYNETSNAVTEQVIKGNIAIIKHTDDGSTQIETAEKGAEFQIYLKSAGSFVNANKDEKDTIVCDEDGFASSKLMPYGVYTVHQTKGWDGREKIKDFDVFISSDGKTYKFLINNANFKSYLKVVKLDKETGKQIAYEGAAFEIYDSDGHRVNMQFTYPQVTTIHTFYTNSEGYLITPEKLPYGDYTLVEVQAPYGYVLDSTPISFTITQENSSTDTGVTVVKVKARDMAQKGVIEITKTGEVFESINENEGIYTPVYETQNLANAVFEIYAAEDITTLDGTVRYYQGEKVDEISTGENGVAKSKELYLGKYTVIEKTAPNGYVNANEQYNVELTYAGQNVSVTSTAFTVNNDRQKVTVSLEKALEKDKLFNIGDNDEILSVQFGVFANEDITAADGSIIPKDALITFANCDIDGKITFDCDLPIGYEFYAKEISTDEHYILDDTQYEFNTEYQGQTVSTIDIKINNDKDILNNLIYGSVKGFKYDRETNEPIGNALFGLFNSDETEFTEENAILTAESDKDGVFTFESIPYGNWIICELKAADGYLENTDIYHICVDHNEQVVTLNIANDRIPELKTTATVDGKKKVTAGGKITIDDVVEFKHLIPGKEYVIKGILMDKSTGKPFKVNGKEITSEVKFIPEKSNGAVTVTFTFDSSEIKKETDIVVFESLYRDGVEIATHADIKDEGQTVTVKIPVPKTPKTGDERNYGVWIGLGAIALGGAFSALILKIKSRKAEDDE